MSFYTRRRCVIVMALIVLGAIGARDSEKVHANTECLDGCYVFREMFIPNSEPGEDGIPAFKKATGTLEAWDPFVAEDSVLDQWVEIIVSVDPLRSIGIGWIKAATDPLPVRYEYCSWCTKQYEYRGEMQPAEKTDWSWEFEPGSRGWTLFVEDEAVRTLIVPNGGGSGAGIYYTAGAAVFGSDETEMGISAHINLTFSIQGMAQCGGTGEPACSGPWVPTNTNPWLLRSTANNLYFSHFFAPGTVQVYSNCYRLNNCSH